jgi:hypothetical protein
LSLNKNTIIMDYNSDRKLLKIPEYGRHIQKMVQQAVEIEDREERTKYTGNIIKVMGNLFPYLRDVAEFKQKLYDHLSSMSDFKLDIDTEYVLPTSDALQVKVEPMKYPQSNIKLRYYGRNVEDMINACVKIEDLSIRMRMANSIANQMKNSFLQWNKNVVVDDKIYKDLNMLSEGVLDYSEADFKLAEPGSQRHQTGGYKKPQPQAHKKRRK